MPGNGIEVRERGKSDRGTGGHRPQDTTRETPGGGEAEGRGMLGTGGGNERIRPEKSTEVVIERGWTEETKTDTETDDEHFWWT